METITVKNEELNMPLNKKESFFDKVVKQRYLFYMSVPFIIWLIIFRFIPLWGWIMAFQDFKPGLPFSQQTWVGFKHFKELFADPQFYRVMRNTLSMSLMQLIIGFPLPIIFALLLNEVKHLKFKKFIQTISYLPHFVSWVIVASLFSKLLSIDGGIVNEILLKLHIIKEPVQFLAKPKMFWGIVVTAEIWKELGWNSIIFLASISGIDPSLYEAATVDGAGRWKKMWYITLPSIMPTAIVILVLNIGWIISIGFEKQFLFGNAVVKDYSEVLDLYVLNYGIGLQRYSFGTAIGIFKSVVSIILLFLANSFAKKVHGESVV